MKSLKKFEFSTPADRQTYDWNKLLDGGIYKLESGTDYTCKDQTMVMMTKNQAERQGTKAKVQKVEGGIVLQADPPATDATRAKAKKEREKAAAKAKADKAAGTQEAEGGEGEEAGEGEAAE